MAARNQSLIEIYRANIANPETLDALRFWASNELKRIESMGSSIEEKFYTTDQQIAELQGLIDAINAGGAEQGDKGDKGDQGDQGDKGDKGDQGDPASAAALIADGEIRTDKTWSSSKIRSELDTKQDPHDYNSWQPNHNNQFTYPKWSVVAEAGYLAISNKPTGDLPTPALLGVEADVFATTPGWTSTPTHAGNVRSGYTLTLLEPVLITSVEVWPPEVLAENHYTLVIIKNPADSGAVTRRVPLLNGQLTAGVWSTIPIESIAGAEGEVYRFYLEVQTYSATTSIAGQYKFQFEYFAGDMGVPTPSVGYFIYDFQRRVIKINKTDNLAATPALAGAIVGTIIAMTKSATVFATFMVTGAFTDIGTYREWPAQQIDGNGAFVFDDVCTMAVTVPTSTSAKYVALTSQWTTPPRWCTAVAFLEHGGVDQVPTVTTGYGVNLRVQQLGQSKDWDLIPIRCCSDSDRGATGLIDLDGGSSSEAYLASQAIDGGSASSVYLPGQIISGGFA